MIRPDAQVIAAIPRKRGRPPMRREERLASVLQARITDDLRSRIESAAADNHRSVSEEAAVRLYKSFGLSYSVELNKWE